jgi:cation transport ATPase
MELTLDPLEKYAETLRRCCAVLDNCCRRMCCFVNPPPSVISTRAPRLLRACEVVGNEDTEPNLLISPKCGPTAKPGSTALHLEIRGMDCADCVPKVARVLGRLPSVTAIETDYFSGRAQLRYHPETISPSTITAYLARATGFGIKEIMGADPETSSHLRITVSFPGPPPAAIANKYDVSRAEPRGVWSISFRVTGEKALLPRDVLAELEEHGGQLYTESVEQTNDPASRDLRDLIVRTALCVTCTVPVLVLAWAPLPHSPALYGGLSVGLATIVQFLAAPMYSSTARSVLFIRQVDLNVLAAVSTLISYIFSVVAYAFDVAGKPFSVPFFETCTLLVTLIYSGRTVQCATRKSAGSAINALRTLQTKGVRLIENGTVRSIDSRLLHYGDTIEILAHTRIVTDGVVLSGSSDVDESSVTGESAAVSKIPGNLVVAGTINLDGTLRVQVTKLLHENSLSKISQLVQRAQSSRAPLQDLADRLSAVILPLAVAVAGLAFLTWTLVGVVAKKRPKHEAALDGAMYAIAIVVVSCPCAIGLAVSVPFHPYVDGY